MQTRGRAAFLVAAGYLIATLLYLAPLLPRWETEVPRFRSGFDVPFQAFLVGWGWDALRHHPLTLFDAPIFHPERLTLTYMDHLLGEVVVAAPVLAVTRSVASAYNVLILLTYVFSAWFTYRLARALGIPRAGAFLSGLLYSFSTYRLTNIDFLNQLQTQFLPLGLYFGVRYLESLEFRHAFRLALTAVVQVYFGWYYANILLVMIGLLALYAWAGHRPLLPRAGRRRYLFLALGALGLIAPVVAPYLIERAAMPEFRRTLGQTALYSADLLDYVRPSDLALPAGRFFLPGVVNGLFPGLVMVVLAWFGFRSVRASNGRTSGIDEGSRRSWAGRLRDAAARGGMAGFLPLLALSSFVLSLGPILHVAAHRYLIPLPYALLYFVLPGISSLRAPFRFSVLVILAGAVLAGFGYAAVDRNGVRTRVQRIALFGLLVAVTMASAWPAPFRTLAIPTAASMPPVYRWLRDRQPKEPLLEFPTPATDADETQTQALRQYCALLHGSPRLDGCSGFVSPRYRIFRHEIQRFPDPASLVMADAMGARWIVVHFADYPIEAGEALRRRIEARWELTKVAAFGDDVLYRLDLRPARFASGGTAP